MINRKKILALLLSSTMAFGMLPTDTAWVQMKNAKAASEDEVTVSEKQVNGDYGLASNIQDGTILHCFDWKYNDIKEELPNIAAAGFTAVQTSPAQKGDGDTWYWLYQPQSFSVQPNALGNKEELAALCTEAKKYGIKVVVDIVANHTRSVGDAGLDGSCYHNEGDAWYTDRRGITHGKIGMPDLMSENTRVQETVKGYVEELKSIGVEGTRWDAAKHIQVPSEDNCQFWPVVSQVGLYMYGEILVGPLESGGDNIMKEYTNYMSVTDSTYGKNVRDALAGGSVPGSIGNWSERGIAKNKLVYWAESHDTYSNNGEYGEASQFIDQNKIDRAYAIVAGQGKATSLYFSRPAQTDKQSIKAGEKGSTHFASKEVAAVNHLHNNCIGEKDFYVNENNTAAVCRESGAVIVKGSGSGDVSVTNGGGTTAPGTYKDEITGNQFTVTADKISGSVGDTGIAVIYKAGTGGSSTGGSTGGSTATTAPTPSQSSGGSTTSGAQRIYFDNSSYNWSSVYAYIYNSDTDSAAKWPGTQMTKDSATGYFYVDVPSAYAKGKVIFTESETATDNRYPADMKPGLELESSTKLFKTGNAFEAYTAPDDNKNETKETATPKPTATQSENVTKATATPKPTENAKTPTTAPTQPTTVPSASATPTVKPTTVPTANAQNTPAPTTNTEGNTVPTATPNVTTTPNATASVTATPNVTTGTAVSKLSLVTELSNEEKEQLTIGDSFNVKAIAYGADGKEINNVKVNWSSNNESVAFVDSKGMVVCKGVGIAVIRATVEGNSATAAMDITVHATKKSGNSYLAKLKISKGKLSPSFKKSVYTYKITLAKNVSRVKITPTKADSKASIKINGKKAKAVVLSIRRGQTRTVKIQVIAQNGSKKNYTVKIKRK